MKKKLGVREKQAFDFAWTDFWNGTDLKNRGKKIKIWQVGMSNARSWLTWDNSRVIWRNRSTGELWIKMDFIDQRIAAAIRRLGLDLFYRDGDLFLEGSRWDGSWKLIQPGENGEGIGRDKPIL